ncbi:restriction endonuclease subunit S [Oceanivirga salmonicida]|uniref:restriction endonuclease subunit S n=1 Tax=Oceanivirga salmonicida TaxID=1769291 RepID=UPI0012E1F671|nr:restriction endonuclease subunit S [Oceanivirga salmonicida]
MKYKRKMILAEKFCLNVTDGTHYSPKYIENGKKLVTSKHLNRYNIDFSSAKNISESDFIEINKRSKVDQYDILISMIGTVGNIYIEKNNKIEYACKNVGIFKMGGDYQKAYYLYYYLQSKKGQEYIVSNLRGTTQSYLTLNSLRKFPIGIFEEKIQNKIVSILKNIDDKIELNSKINDNLAA